MRISPTTALQLVATISSRIMINYLYVDNFKSLRNVSVLLSNFASFCGPNGSGKSNFADAWDFLGQTFGIGLAYAVAEKGGFYNMGFRRQRRSRGAVSFQIAGQVSSASGPVSSIDYRIGFSLQAKGEAIRSDFLVSGDRYVFTISEATQFGSSLTVIRENDKYVFNSMFSDQLISAFPHLAHISNWAELIRPPARDLLYPARISDVFPFDVINHQVGSIRVFRINPRNARLTGTPSVSGELGKYGENLPSALDYMIANNPRGFEALKSWLKNVVPTLESLRTDYTETKQLGLFLQESGLGSPCYAEDLSDGTLMSIALFFAILDDRHKFVFIEEPENSLHPWILKTYLECYAETPAQREVFITTQSPFVVANANPSKLFLIEKSSGRTEITNALDREPDLAKIIKQDFLNLGEYWLSGGLKAVPEPAADTEDTLFKDADE